VREALKSACREQVAKAESKSVEASQELQQSQNMLESAIQAEMEVQQAVADARQNLESAEATLSAAVSALSACLAQSDDEDGRSPDCSSEESDVVVATAAVGSAQAELEQAQADLELVKENRQAMEQRIELAKQALAMAEQTLEQSQAECVVRLAGLSQSVDMATGRLTAAQQALNAYLATNPSASRFHSWLNWNPSQHGVPITPDILRDRMNLSAEQRSLLQEYLYNRKPSWHGLVDKYRGEWAEAKGDVERNIVARKVRIHLSGEFAEQMTRHALAPLGGGIETQGRTLVGDNGLYTKTDLLVTDLRVPVILGRGEVMGAPVGGSMAFEVKCGKADYLYKEKDHMVFQAEGHKQADAHCTLCSRDIHDLPPEKEKELRDTLRKAGSPLVGMLPRKNEIDQSCLGFIRQGEGEKL
jgi:hypothetical protein